MNPNTIREFAASFQKSRILLSGIELDIFTNINVSGTTGNQIANHLHLNERACERLLNALVSLGFLTKKNPKRSSRRSIPGTSRIWSMPLCPSFTV
jgi:Fic family protein